MGKALTVKFTPLSLPVTTGLLETTLTRYPVPDACPPGIVALIVPAAVEVIVPIVTGLANEPLASDNCAVKIFPALKVPVMV